MTINCHIEDTSDSVAASFQINYLLLNQWFRKFVGRRLEIPKSAFTVECEVLGTPVPENVFVEPGLRSKQDYSTWFWMKRYSRDSGIKERFFLVLEEAELSRTIYVRNFVSSRFELSAADYYGQDKLAVERALSDRFQAFLMSHLEVEFY